MRRDVKIIAEALQRLVGEEIEPIGDSAAVELISWERVAERLIEQGTACCTVPLKYVHTLDPPRAITEPLTIEHDLGIKPTYFTGISYTNEEIFGWLPLRADENHVVMPPCDHIKVARVVMMA